MINKTSDAVLSESAPGIHEKALELMKKEKPGILLEPGAGQGYVSDKLKEMGFEVTAADWDVEKFKVASIKCDKIDLNKDFPYSDSSFDYVVCLETLEHLENPHHLIREFYRMLKKGGKLLISTPNILNIHARLRYLMRGSPDWIHAELQRFNPNDLYQALRRHINMVGFIELKFVLRNYGFNIEEVSSNESVLFYPQGNPFLRPLVAIILFIAAWFVRVTSTIIRRKDPLREELLSDTLLYGEELIVKAVK